MAKNVLVSDATLEITQIKSAIGGKQNQRDTLRSLGLKRIVAAHRAQPVLGRVGRQIRGGDVARVAHLGPRHAAL